MIKVYDCNKRTGEQRKIKSLNLIRDSINVLNENDIKPTIMQVAKVLQGRLGEATIKKYWRIINPKIKPNQKILNSRLDENINTGQLSNKDFIELYIPEWNIKIFKPQYFKEVYSMNTQQANVFYQTQFSNNWLQTSLYWH